MPHLSGVGLGKDGPSRREALLPQPRSPVPQAARPRVGKAAAGAPPAGTCSSVPRRGPICCCSSCLAFTHVATSCCRALTGTASSGSVPLVRLRANSQT